MLAAHQLGHRRPAALAGNVQRRRARPRIDLTCLLSTIIDSRRHLKVEIPLLLNRRKLLAGILAGLPLLAQAQSWGWDDGTTPFVVSPPEVVERMLRLAEPKAGEYLIDLGSGDGGIVIEAAKRFRTRGLRGGNEPRPPEPGRGDAAQAGAPPPGRVVGPGCF